MQKVPLDKIPPQNLDAEKSILGAILIDKDAIGKVVDFLNPEDFYSPAHRIIFSTAINLFEKHEPIDLLSMSNRLEETGRLS